MITINETKQKDLENIINLWNDGEVMKFVGFPNGLNVNIEKMNKWYQWLQNAPDTKHYSIYDDDLGYCGEAFYSYDEEHDLGSLDIKLHKSARGKGIAFKSLSHAINELFLNTPASKCYVDPDPKNTKAWALYKKLGFESKNRPDHLEDGSTYLELTRNLWNELKKEL